MSPIARTVCFGCLALALPTGALGVALGTAGLGKLGGLAMLTAGVMLLLTVGLSLHDMSKTAKQDEADEAAVERMLADGRLAQKLRKLGCDPRHVALITKGQRSDSIADNLR